jgi:hypothetical protein
MYANGPKIVTDGLVLCLDAANRKSYPGSGSTWYDLSNSKKNGTFAASTATPSFSSDNKGSIVFGGNDYVNVSNFEEDSNDALSVFSWVYLTTENLYSDGTYISWIANKRDNGTDNQWQLLVYRDPNSLNMIVPTAVVFNGTTSSIGATAYNGSPSYGMSLNRWHYVGFTTSGVNGGFLRSYVDSNLNGYTTLSGNRKKGSRDLIIGTTAWNLGWTLSWDGNIANVSIYNRALSSDEITQNYNATKGRYGLT